MGNHGNRQPNAATAARLGEGGGEGVHAPLSPRLPDAVTLARADEQFGPYGAMTEAERERGAPEQAAIIARFAGALQDKPAFQAMTRVILDHWSTERYGFRHDAPDAWEGAKTPGEKALWAVYNAYNRIAQTSADEASVTHDPLRLALDDAARAEFGLRDARPAPASAAQAQAQRDYAAAQPGLRLFVRAVYNDTQQWLANHGVHEVYLYRGARYASGAEPKNVTYNNRVEVGKIASNPLSPWATNIYTASAYAHSWSEHDAAHNGYGITRAAAVPATRIFAMEQQGFAAAGEAEVSVLGGLDSVLVKGEHPIGSLGSMNTDAILREFAHASQPKGAERQ